MKLLTPARTFQQAFTLARYMVAQPIRLPGPKTSVGLGTPLRLENPFCTFLLTQREFLLQML
jgi:hypothetical protein